MFVNQCFLILPSQAKVGLALVLAVRAHDPILLDEVLFDTAGVRLS